MRAKGMDFENFDVDAQTSAGADFLHCRVTDSMWLERAESLITSKQ